MASCGAWQAMQSERYCKYTKHQGVKCDTDAKKAKRAEFDRIQQEWHKAHRVWTKNWGHDDEKQQAFGSDDGLHTEGKDRRGDGMRYRTSHEEAIYRRSLYNVKTSKKMST